MKSPTLFEIECPVSAEEFTAPTGVPLAVRACRPLVLLAAVREHRHFKQRLPDTTKRPRWKGLWC
jgi:hypothetical protein